MKKTLYLLLLLTTSEVQIWPTVLFRILLLTLWRRFPFLDEAIEIAAINFIKVLLDEIAEICAIDLVEVALGIAESHAAAERKINSNK